MNTVPFGIRVWQIDGAFQMQHWTGAGACLFNDYYLGPLDAQILFSRHVVLAPTVDTLQFRPSAEYA